MTHSQTIQDCFLCGSSAFGPTGQSLDLADVLGRWQREVGVLLRHSVWQEYTTPASRRVALYQCERCGFAMFLPPLAGSSAFYTDIAAKNYYIPQKWEFFQAIRDIKHFQIRRLLDIGCGSGDFLSLLRNSLPATECIGYEFNPDAAKKARARGYTVYDGLFPDCVVRATAGQRFDAVCMFQVLEHLSDPAGIIQDAQTLLNPNGLIIVGVPNAAGPLRYFTDALTDIPPHHVSRWCESTFRIGTSTLGLKVLRLVKEPLPDYLWDSYLPVMLERDLTPEGLGRFLNSRGFTRRLIGLLRRLHIRWLWGLPGHTLYVVLQFEQS